MLKYLIPTACVLLGCPAPLAKQRSLAARVHRATIDCVAAVSPKKAKVCAQAQLCQQTARGAAEALQAANSARSAGDTDVAAEAKAAGLDVLADTACKQGGW